MICRNIKPIIMFLLSWKIKDVIIFPPQIEVVKTLLSRGINPSLKDQHDR